MRITSRVWIAVFALSVCSVSLANDKLEALLKEYRQQGAGPFSAAAGKRFWNEQVRKPGVSESRSCTSCHTSNVRQPGRHAVTGKSIKPMAPSVLSRRLTNPAKIRKWLKRNCLWTRGRECSAQEKGNVLTYLKDL